MHPVERALLAAVLANPDDDAVRLVYADWLEENADTKEREEWVDGETRHMGAFYPIRRRVVTKVSDGRAERAEFIRAQVELARGPRPFSVGIGHLATADAEARRQEVLSRRERELLAYHAFDLLRVEGLAAHYNPGTAEYGWLVKKASEGSRWIAAAFRRGFVEVVTCTTADWLAHGKAIVASQLVREVRLSDKRPAFPINRFCWFMAPEDDAPIQMSGRSLLPKELFYPLPTNEWNWAEEALAALSTACLAWARSA